MKTSDFCHPDYPDARLVHSVIRALCCAAVVCALCATGCSPVRQIRPLARHEQTIAVSLGGPISNVEGVYAPFPPDLSLAYHHGVLDSLFDVYGALHPVGALNGILDIEAGANWRPIAGGGLAPGLLVSPHAFFLTNFKERGTRLYPALCLTAVWRLRPNWFAYTGLDNWLELYGYREDYNTQQHVWFPTPHLGFEAGNGRWQVQLETKLYVPHLSNSGRGPENPGIGGKGVWGVFAGFTRGVRTGGGK